MVELDGRAAVVERDDPAFGAVQVARAHMPVDADAVADDERRQRGDGADRVQEVLARVDRLGERREVWVERAVGYLLEQESFWICVAAWSAWSGWQRVR